MKNKYESTVSERERILMNVASQLAYELYCMQSSMRCREYMNDPGNADRLKICGGFSSDQKFLKGDLVMCMTSINLQENPWLVSSVENPYILGGGMLLRALGTNQTCNYSNESFAKIVGIPERLLWEGDKRKFADKLKKVVAKLDTYIHRFRMVSFPEDGFADVMFGECFGGIGKKTMPYVIRVAFTAKTNLKEIRKRLIDGGFGVREFEEAKTGEDNRPNPQPITRSDVVGVLKKEGIL